MKTEITAMCVYTPIFIWDENWYKQCYQLGGVSINLENICVEEGIKRVRL